MKEKKELRTRFKEDWLHSKNTIIVSMYLYEEGFISPNVRILSPQTSLIDAKYEICCRVPTLLRSVTCKKERKKERKKENKNLNWIKPKNHTSQN
jgi:hypothetical protein